MSEQLVTVMRGNSIESRHFGDVAVVRPDGTLLGSVGDPGRVTYARSAAKPLQALPLVESGAAAAFTMSDAEIALCCASHSGEPEHVTGVRALLHRAGIGERYLQCGIHPPYHAASAERMVKSGENAQAVHNNCSGKHTGMLLMAKFLGADLDTYLDLTHPVQQQILRTVAEVTDVPIPDIGISVDGCGAPVFALPLRGLALAYARFVAPDRLDVRRVQAMRRIASAMMTYPQLVAGTGRFCTALMTSTAQQILGKTGAEGVYCAGSVVHGVGLCVKVDDGNSRAAYPTVVETLIQFGIIDERARELLAPWHSPLLLNHAGTTVGQIRPVFTVHKT